jgi:surfeit locus 1 family protein
MTTTLLCSLGFWQLSRAHQKEMILAALSEQQDDIPLSAANLLQQGDLSLLRYRQVKLKGIFLNNHTILLDNKINNGRVGYHVLVPFALDNQTITLVNRGWIPLGASRAAAVTIPPIKGEVTIEGYLDFAYRNPFIKETLETHSIEWPLRMQQLDLDLLHSLIGKKILKMLVTLDNNSPYVFVASSKPGTSMPPSRHIGYAVQWFSLAATLLACYFFRHKLKGKA